MAVFNVTDHIVWGGRPRKEAIIAWLTTNVGTFYGPGGHGVIAIGAGWQLQVTEEINPTTNDLHCQWEVDITDEGKATLFALTQL